MGEVVCFETGEPIKGHNPIKRDDTVEIIEALYQRRFQIDSLIICATTQKGITPLWSAVYLEKDELERLQSHLNRHINRVLGDYGEELSFDGEEADD